MAVTLHEICHWPHYAGRIYAPFIKKAVLDSISSNGVAGNRIEISSSIKKTVEDGTGHGRHFIYELINQKGFYTTMSVYSKIKVLKIVIRRGNNDGHHRAKDNRIFQRACGRRRLDKAGFFKFLAIGDMKLSIHITIEITNM